MGQPGACASLTVSELEMTTGCIVGSQQRQSDVLGYLSFPLGNLGPWHLLYVNVMLTSTTYLNLDAAQVHPFLARVVASFRRIVLLPHCKKTVKELTE